MKITLESTTKIVQLTMGAVTVPARIWEGATDTGIPVHCYVTRIAVAEGRPDADYKQFEEQLQEHRKASAAIEAIPLRLIL